MNQYFISFVYFPLVSKPRLNLDNLKQIYWPLWTLIYIWEEYLQTIWLERSFALWDKSMIQVHWRVTYLKSRGFDGKYSRNKNAPSL